MLLRALKGFYDRARKQGLIQDPEREKESIQDPAFTEKYVRWMIPLDSEGNVQGGFIERPDLKKGKKLSVPRTSRAKVGAGVAEFLCDGIDSVFGLPADQTKVETEKQKQNRLKKVEDFWRQIEEGFKATNSPELEAVLKSREKIKAYLRWGKLSEEKKETWLIKSASGNESEFKSGDLFTFQVNGKLLLDDENLREFWRSYYAKEIAQSRQSAEKGFCLVTGQENVEIQPSHLPKIKGVPGAVATGAALVSFDKEAFCSYGFDQSYNSPVSFDAVEAYTNALNHLLKSKKNTIRIGSSTVIVFWAERSEEASDLFSEIFENPDEKNLEKLFKQPYYGEATKLDFDDEEFYSVSLSGNGGRIIVRDWIQMPVYQARQNFRKWFEDLRLISLKPLEEYKKHPLSLSELARSTLRRVTSQGQGGSKQAGEVYASVLTDLYSSALRATAPSLSIAHKLLLRLKTELAKDGYPTLYNFSRFALLKLIINRHKKEKEPMIDYQLNEQIDDIAYNCGRLLAVFAELQRAAHGSDFEGATIVERYYGMASTAPNSAFPILWRLHHHHLRKLRGEKSHVAEAYRRKIAQIVQNFKSVGDSAPEFPTRFDLREQGRFALGFYQQIAYEQSQRAAARKQKEIIEQGDENNE